MAFVKQEGNNVHILWSTTTEYFADSVEWCPISPYQDVFVCGQYQLEEHDKNNTEQSRIGAIYLFQADVICNKKCVHLQTVSTPGVLDMKWCPKKTGEYCLLGVATADGTVEIYHLSTNKERNNEQSTLHLVSISKNKPNPFSSNLILSLDWHQGKEDPEKSYLVASESSGKIYLMHLNGNELRVVTSTQAHEFQAWISCFDYHNPCVIYSGGDDTLFKGWDTRSGFHSPLFTNKSHSMGVTSLHSSRKKEFLLLSGSYDEIIRLWDTRKMKQPITETKVGGGIWRLKWDPHTEQYILAACNENGTKILKVQQEDFSMQIIASSNFHSSLAYGADWCWLHPTSTNENLKENNYVIASCSFYDKHLCLWEATLKDGLCIVNK